MAVSLFILVILGLLISWASSKINIPGLVGMLFIGIAAGPYVFGFMDPALQAIGADLRMVALIVILLRAGFELSKKSLHRVGRMALLLSFVPATLECIAVVFLAHRLLGLDYLASAILGAILGAVSPAVVVPSMIKFIEERRGTKKGIPTLLIAASSIDDVYVIVGYSMLMGFYTGTQVNVAWKIATIPISICLGILLGIGIGLVLYRLFARFNPRATKRVLAVLGISVVLVHAEHMAAQWLPFAALLAVMAIGFIILEKNEIMAHEISAKLAKIWIFAEIVLFTLVGAQVNITVALHTGLAGALVIVLGLCARSAGTLLCLVGSDLTMHERLFVVISYLPKATVQAAIGAAPLMAMKLAGLDTGPGEIILAVAVLSILLTAPAGAWAISLAGKRWLSADK